MKKILFVLFVFWGMITIANPILLPSMWFSELYFDGEDHWQIEIQYADLDPDNFTIESVWLYSMTDSVEIPFSGSAPGGYYLVVESDLSGSMDINPEGDTLRLKYTLGIWGDSETYTDEFRYGNVEGASIAAPEEDQSLVCMFGWSKDSSPTLGYANDTAGVMGTLTGLVYDVNDVLVENQTLALLYPFTTGGTGEYHARVPSRNLEYSYIRQVFPSTHYVSMEPVSLVMEPDSVVIRNIYLTDTLWLGLSPETNRSVDCYPNPLGKGETLKFNLNLPCNSSALRVELYTESGVLVMTEAVHEKTFTMNPPVEKGVYLVVIRNDQTVFRKSKLVVNE